MKSTISLVAMVLAGALPLAAVSAEPAQTPSAADRMGTPAPALPTAPAELPAAGKSEVPPMFKELDRNKDGQISRDEGKRSAEVQSRFDLLDSDHNDKVSLLEWNAGEKHTPRAKP